MKITALESIKASIFNILSQKRSMLSLKPREPCFFSLPQFKDYLTKGYSMILFLVRIKSLKHMKLFTSNFSLGRQTEIPDVYNLLSQLSIV